MTKPVQSQYLRAGRDSALFQRWITTLLLNADLEDHLLFSEIDAKVISALGANDIPKDDRTNAAYMHDWLRRKLIQCDDIGFDESDIFSINTRRIQQLVGFSEVELAIARFAILINSSTVLETASNLCGDELTEIDACDILTRVLGISFEKLYSALNAQGLLRQSGLVKVAASFSSTRRLNGWLQVPELLLQQVFRQQKSSDELNYAYCNRAPRSQLNGNDLKHLNPKLSLIRITFAHP